MRHRLCTCCDDIDFIFDLLKLQEFFPGIFQFIDGREALFKTLQNGLLGFFSGILLRLSFLAGKHWPAFRRLNRLRP